MPPIQEKSPVLDKSPIAPAKNNAARAKFAHLYKLAQGATKRKRQRKAFYLQATTLARGWFNELLLARLTPTQRVQMAGGDVPGLQRFMLDFQGVLQRLPDLAAALQLTDAVVAALSIRDVTLHEIIARAESIVGIAAALRRGDVREIHALTTKVRSTAAALLAGELAPEVRKSIDSLVRALQAFEERYARRQKQRQLRQRRATAALNTVLAANRLAAAVAVPQIDGAVSSGAEDEDAGPSRSTSNDPGLSADTADKFLDLGASAFRACADGLATIEAGLPEGAGVATPDGLDSLYYMDLGAFLARALVSTPALAQAAGVDPAALIELCEECAGATQLKDAMELLVGGARDGRLVQAAWIRLCYGEARAWGRERLTAPGLSPAERLLITTELEGLGEVLDEARERSQERAADTSKKKGDLREQLRDQQGDANLASVKTRVDKGETVPADEYYAAQARQRELDEQDRTDAIAAMTRDEAARAGRRRNR